MRLIVDSIVRATAGEYRVTVETDTSSVPRTFIFRVVTARGIRVVEIPDEFSAFVDNNTGATKDLLAAVMSLDQQHDVEI